jgi:nucleotide-binding universal stress UspA family protein
MYERILVATDLEPAGRAVTAASALGAATGSLELITVTPSSGFYDVDRAELERIAARHGWPPAACTVLIGDDIDTAILGHVERRRRSLLVIGSAGSRPWTIPSAARVSRSILAATREPVLVAGPDVDIDFRPRPTKLVVAVEDQQPDPAVIDAIGRWNSTFGCGRTWLVHACDEVDRVAAFDGWLAAATAACLDVVHDVVRGRDHAAALADFASGVRNPVIITRSRRYTDGHRHLSSTTRDLIRHGHSPVLVVPAREPLDTATGVRAPNRRTAFAASSALG